MTIPTNAPEGANATALSAAPALAGSTVIPALGMTFAEASVRVRELLQAHSAVRGEDDESRRIRDELYDEWDRIGCAVLATPPQTLADALAVLDRLLCPETGMPAGTSGMEVEALTRLRSFLATLVPAPAQNAASPVFELGRWLSAIIAEDRRTDEAFRGVLRRPPAVQARERANDLAREAIEGLLLATKATTPADAAMHALLLPQLADDIESAMAEDDRQAADRAGWRLRRIARSVFDVLVSTAGINPAELSADYFVGDAATLWPPTGAGDLFAANAGFLEPEAGRLALPAEPTSDMIQAAASAAGIGAEAARKVWEAMAALARPAGA